MRLVLTMAAIVSLGFSSAAAQSVEQPARPVVDRGALEQNALELTAEVEALQNELKAAVEAAGGDTDKANIRIDALIMAFQPQLDSFVELYIRFYDGLLEKPVDTDARTALLTARDESVEALRMMPDTLRQRAFNP